MGTLILTGSVNWQMPVSLCDMSSADSTYHPTICELQTLVSMSNLITSEDLYPDQTEQKNSSNSGELFDGSGDGTSSRKPFQ